MAANWQLWMPFHVDRFRGSQSVQAMHPAARAGYLYLLAECWQSDDCTVSADPFDLATASGLGDELWAQYGPRILRKFRATDDGRLVNDVLADEWRNARDVFNRRSESARKTTAKRSGNTAKQEDADDVPTVSLAERDAEPSGPSRSASHTVTPSRHTNMDMDIDIDIDKSKSKNASASLPDDDVEPQAMPPMPGEADEPASAAGPRAMQPMPKVHPVSASELEMIYWEYPRKVEKPEALKAIRKAVQHLESGADVPRMTTAEALVFLRDRVQRFAWSPCGMAGQFTPHPATWMNKQRYLEDEKEWQRGEENGANRASAGGGNEGRRSSARTAAQQRHDDSMREIAGAFGYGGGEPRDGAADGPGEGELRDADAAGGMGRADGVTLDGHRGQAWHGRVA